MNVNELKEGRKKIYDDLESLITKAEFENRDLTPEEKAQRNIALEKMKTLDAEIQAAEELERRRLIMAAGHINQRNKEKENAEMGKYSLAKALREMKLGSISGLEREVQAELEMRMKDTAIPWESGLLIPLAATKRDVVAGSSTLVGTEPKGFYEALIEKSVFGPGKLNATWITGLRYNVALPALTGALTAYALSSENDQITESQPTIAGPSLSPKRIGGYMEVSEMLLMQANPSIDQLLFNHILRVVNAKLEQQVIHGPGSGAITGIVNTSGIGSVAGGTNGAAPTWSHIIDLESAVANANADLGDLGYLTNSKVRGKLKKTEKSTSGTIGNWIWDSDNTVNGYKTAVTNNVSSTLKKGTSTGVCSAIIFGNFTDLAIASWGDAINIVRDPYSKADYALERFIVNGFFDAAPIHAASFSAMLDALTT